MIEKRFAGEVSSKLQEVWKLLLTLWPVEAGLSLDEDLTNDKDYAKENEDLTCEEKRFGV
jgi:hypothetical protein